MPLRETGLVEMEGWYAGLNFLWNKASFGYGLEKARGKLEKRHEQAQLKPFLLVK